MDVLTPEQRHKNMSRIRGKDTKPEIWLRKKLFAIGHRYRKNTSSIPGHPDIWMKKYNTAVFIHGCFWHRHTGCKYASIPKTRTEFWNEKFCRNIERDKVVLEELKNLNIKTLIVWECTIKQMMRCQEYTKSILGEIEGFLMSDELYKEL